MMICLTLEGTHVRTETSNVSSPRSHTKRFSLPSFCKGTEDRECPRPACTLSSFTSSVFGMIETTNAQTTESILDSNMNLCTINKSTPWLASCLASCLASWTFVIVSALQDVAMVPARKSHQQNPKGADFARCWNNQENDTMQTWWILCGLWRLQTNSPSRKTTSSKSINAHQKLSTLVSLVGKLWLGKLPKSEEYHLLCWLWS